MVEHLLAGCRPEPLGAYLQGLGVLRVIGEQADPSATGSWTDGGFVLSTVLDRDQLIEFFLQRYAPSPMVAPWNKGSGFFPGRSASTAMERLEAAECSQDARFEKLRAAIAVGRRIVSSLQDDELSKNKGQVIARARSEMPDEALWCLDAAVALTDGDEVYAPLLGTGFNFGRQDLTSNYLGHLDAILGFDGKPDDASGAWLHDALFGTETVARKGASVGQFDPGHAGGVNASTFDGAEGLVNPWGFVLQLEGALVFSSAVSRRLGTWRDSRAAVPFTMRPTPAGSGHLSPGEKAKAELWLPLWGVPATISEVRRFFAEARMRWRGVAATTGVDAARAVATLGVDRGIDAFSRVVIAERLGQNPLAVTAGRAIAAFHKGVVPTAALDGWVAAVRRVRGGPASIQSGLRAIDEVLMGLALRDPRADPAALLRAVADLEEIIRRNARMRDECRPVPWLEPKPWLELLDDGSCEFQVAWALASGTETDTPADTDAFRTVWRPSMRAYIRGIAGGRRPRWASGPQIDVDLRRDPIGGLAAIHAAHATDPATFDGFVGAVTVFRVGRRVPGRAVEAFAAGMLDERAIGEWLRILVLLGPGSERLDTRSEAAPDAVVPAWRYLVPLFHAHLPEGPWEGLLADPSWPSALRRGNVSAVLRSALGRLRAHVGDIKEPDVLFLARGVDPRRLGAALLIGVPRQDLQAIVRSITDQRKENAV